MEEPFVPELPAAGVESQPTLEQQTEPNVEARATENPAAQAEPPEENTNQTPANPSPEAQ
jgi:hypothetical protein